MEIHPSLAVSEEYTDNVFVTETNRVTDYITRAMPGISFKHDGARIKSEAAYSYDYRYYARRTRDNDSTHAASFNSHITVAQELLFIDLDDRYQRVSLDVTRDTTKESLFRDQVDRNIATVSPYFDFEAGRSRIKTGYRYTDTRYRDKGAVDKVDHTAFMEISREFSGRWSGTGRYNFTREESEADGFDQHQGAGGIRYEYAGNSFFMAEAGEIWTLYRNATKSENLFWNAGLTHSFAAAKVMLSTGVRYVENPLRDITREIFVNGRFEKTLNGGAAGISLAYSEYGEPRQVKKYSASADGRYRFGSRLSGSADFSAERYEFAGENADARRLIASAGLEYLLGEQLTVSLTYIFVDYRSTDGETATGSDLPFLLRDDDLRVNRGILEIKKVF